MNYLCCEELIHRFREAAESLSKEKEAHAMARWKFYINRPSGNFWNPYEKVEAGIFEGTEDEARTELRARIDRTWSPFITHEFESANENINQILPMSNDGLGGEPSV